MKSSRANISVWWIIMMVENLQWLESLQLLEEQRNLPTPTLKKMPSSDLISANGKNQRSLLVALRFRGKLWNIQGSAKSDVCHPWQASSLSNLENSWVKPRVLSFSSHLTKFSTSFWLDLAFSLSIWKVTTRWRSTEINKKRNCPVHRPQDFWPI